MIRTRPATLCTQVASGLRLQDRHAVGRSRQRAPFILSVKLGFQRREGVSPEEK